MRQILKCKRLTGEFFPPVWRIFMFIPFCDSSLSRWLYRIFNLPTGKDDGGGDGSHGGHACVTRYSEKHRCGGSL